MSESPVDPWLVLRTRSRHENVVESALQHREVVAYLPKLKVAKAGAGHGHKRQVELPLFPGYLFVRPRADQYEGMRYIRGSCGFVMAAGARPATLPEKDVHAVKTLVDSGAVLTVDPELAAGQRVKITAGAFAGVEGELVRVKNQQLLVINVDLVGCSIRVEVDRQSISSI